MTYIRAAGMLCLVFPALMGFGCSDVPNRYTTDGSVPSSLAAATLPIAAGQSTDSLTYRSVSVGTTLNAGLSHSSAILAPATPTISRSFFGLTILNFKNVSPTMLFGTTRSWDAYPALDWADANPSLGMYNFTSLDEFISLNQSRNTEIIYTFGRTPPWASSQPGAPGPYGLGQCAPPADLNAWDNYVRAVVTHVAGRIKYWEIWNEPNAPNFYCGDISTMVAMAQRASRIIKRIDPSALILSPAVTGGPGPNWLAEFLARGGTHYVDVIAFHGYWSARAEDVVDVISRYRTVMAANGASEKALWDTESSWSGFGNLGTPSSAQQVGFVAKDYLLHWSQGVSRFVWYAYDGGTIWGGLWTSGSGESPAAVSYTEIYRWMVGATLTAPCSANHNGIWICPLARPDGYKAEAVWISNQTAVFQVPVKYIEYRDLAGSVHPITSRTVTVGDQPILFETAPRR
jgi:polysaccharide biosynthesis protein PslG